MTDGLLVLVQLVIAAITTAPCVISDRLAVADGARRRRSSPRQGESALGNRRSQRRRQS